MSGTNTEVKLQEPGEVIKPIVPNSVIKDLVWNLYGLKVKHWVELNSYDDRNFHVTVEDQSENPYLKDVSSNGYVFKVLNTMESQRPTLIEAQHALLSHVRERGVATQEVMKNVKGETMSLEKIYTTEDAQEGSKYGMYIVRLLSYIPGEIFHVMPYVPQTFYKAGKFVGELHNAIKDFHHPFYDTHTTIWSLEQMEKIDAFVFVIKDPDDNKLVKEVLQAFSQDVVKNYDKLKKGIIHGDLNEQNILVTEMPDQEDTPKERRVCDVTGLLDFSDVTNSYLVFDVAIAICYLSIECKVIDQLDVGGHILAGYLKERCLNETEWDVMQVCVCARLVQSLVYGAYTNFMDPSNTYVLTTSNMGWPLLRILWKCKKDQLYQKWKEIIASYS